MHVISRAKLKKFYTKDGHQKSKSALEAWYHEAKKSQWRSWTDIKEKYRSASILKGNRVVFNMAGNKYRLIVKINFPTQTVFIRFVGTHKEYDKINAEVI